MLGFLCSKICCRVFLTKLILILILIFSNLILNSKPVFHLTYNIKQNNKKTSFDSHLEILVTLSFFTNICETNFFCIIKFSRSS